MSWKTLLVSLLCLGGAAAGGYVLYQDLNGRGVGGSGKPIAKIERREATVRHKAASSYMWTNALVSEDLFRKDSVQTGRGSAVSIRLNDGSLLDLGENSLVIMDDTTNLALNFLRGSVVVHKADGDSQISVDKNGKTQVQQLSIRLTQPEPLSRFYAASALEKKPITFAWENKSKNVTDRFTVQVSTNKTFSIQSTRQVTSNDPKNSFAKLDLPAGDYFWRVLSKGQTLSEVRQFRVIQAFALQITSPLNLQKIQKPADDDGIPFRWVIPKTENADFAQGEHRIEIARDTAFKALVASENIDPVTGSFTAHRVPDGIYYWRIRSLYGNFSMFSAVRQFEFKKAAPAPKPKEMGTPSKILPESGAVFNIIENKDPVEASWGEVAEADSYELVVYQDSNGNGAQKEVFHTTTSKTHLSFKGLTAGEYLWTLRSIDKNKKPGPYLPLRKLSLTYGNLLAPPEVISPEVQ